MSENLHYFEAERSDPVEIAVKRLSQRVLDFAEPRREREEK